MPDISDIKVNVESQTGIQKNMGKYIDFVSWARWNPDLLLDLCRPPEGGINLGFDQRVFIRCIVRFASLYGCFPRGYGKTWIEFAAMFITAICYPNIDLSITAQTKENAAKLLRDKYVELMRQYPILENEVSKSSFSRNDAYIVLKNGSRIDALANSQSSKGQRRKRISVEESALMNNETFEDALKPIVEVPRYTCGKLAVVNPEELNQQIHFFTTPSWRGSDEFHRSCNMVRNMVDCKGDMVLGSSWLLGCWYGRGSNKSQILQKKGEMSPIAFEQNYGGTWTGSSTGALIEINKLMDCRTLSKPESDLSAIDKHGEYYLGVDVARSQNTNNNQSSIVVGKVKRHPTRNRIISVEIVNVINVPNILNFTNQAIVIKRCKELYNAKMIIVDGNGLGTGLIDALLQDTIDPITNESLGCWNTVNTDNEPELPNAEKCLYDLKSQGSQSQIIVNFINMVDSKVLKLLQPTQLRDFAQTDEEDFVVDALPFVQTDLMFEEIGNLKIKHNSNGSLSVEKVVNKIDKDRFSALSYLLWYINEYENITREAKAINAQAIANLTRRPNFNAGSKRGNSWERIW